MKSFGFLFLLLTLLSACETTEKNTDTYLTDASIPQEEKLKRFLQDAKRLNPKITLQEKSWLNQFYGTRDFQPIFISDNLAFDWQWINFYFHTFYGRNPFGHSGRRIGDLYCGMMKDGGLNQEWKRKYRKTKHTHNPVDDAKGNAEALLEFKKLGLKIPTK